MRYSSAPTEIDLEYNYLIIFDVLPASPADAGTPAKRVRESALVPGTLRLRMTSGEPKVESTKDTISSLPGGRSWSAAMTGGSSLLEVDDRIGRAIASVP